jgi:serine/threonine protein kinase
MAVSIGDIVAAKMIAQLGWLAAARLREELVGLDAAPATEDLVARLARRGALDAAQRAKLELYVDLYERVRREALYCALIERSRLLPKAELATWKQRLESEGYATSLGEHLLAARRITPIQAGQLRRQQFLGIDKENDKAVESYRRSGFEGVGRAITKDPKARLETRSFTIKDLFRSAESQKLARTAMLATTASEHPAKVGAYEIVRVLGRGGMGIVLEARHEKGGQTVALKLAHVKDAVSGAEVKARMRREILATSMLHHENIVQVLDAGETEHGTPFLVMELVTGRELRELLRERKAFPPREALSIFLQVLAAAGAAHRAGIVHRDLKPENVLVADEGGRFAAKLMDFGLARILEIDPAHEDKVFQTHAQDTVSGSPQYLSPEQVLGDAVDARADLYALGVLLFELLTGELPWSVSSVNAMIRAHISRPPRTLAAARAGSIFPAVLEALVASLLGKSPSDRPANAEAVVATIERDVLPALDAKPSPTAEQPHRAKPPRGITRLLDGLRLEDEGF